MKLNTKDMVLIALFAALTAIGAFIKIPIGVVPFSMQFLFCGYSGVILGAKKGFMSQILYVGIGLLGIPVFTEGGGIGYVLKPTFGYLLGFIICAFVVGKLIEKKEKLTFLNVFLPLVLGLSITYIIGVSYMYMILNIYLGVDISINGAIAAGATPFIIPDLGWSTLVAITSLKIVPQLKRLGYI
ncbi:biotin transporter BioY [Serpentinicella sp. ANB-PHB4]|uniref:biotin transporter BioY n=1 Tax=Serpentinicella sp. ANB-PHB4 TaxID=3074076 RepID=UPI002865218A|nr:biotin transporter BioY [Serpentinicella sp. ANB-PHB4]MDR5658467.1 biotin transporter BioY [Serpentinicella sp. ANB-PHB4]